MMMYKEVDVLNIDQVEPGDLVRGPDGSVIQVFKLIEHSNSREIVYIDDYMDEELSFVVPDDETIKLFVYDPD